MLPPKGTTKIRNLLCTTLKVQGGYIPEFFSDEDWQPSPLPHVSQSSKAVQSNVNLDPALSHDRRDRKLRTCRQSSYDKLDSLKYQSLD